MGQIMSETYHDDYHHFEHKTAKRANHSIKNTMLKPVLREMCRAIFKRWTVNQLIEKEEETYGELRELADRIQTIIDVESSSVKISDVLAVKINPFKYLSRLKGYSQVSVMAYKRIGRLLVKNGLSENDVDKLCGHRCKNIAKRMNNQIVLLGKALVALDNDRIIHARI